MNIHFKPIDQHTLKPALKMKVQEGEEKFVAPNAISIAQAYVEPRTYPLVIYNDESPVGFLWYGQYQEDNGDWWLGRLMIDKAHRRKGYAEAAMNLLIREMEQRKVEKFYLSVVPENSDAIALYEKLGFAKTGNILEGEIQYVRIING